MIFNLLAEKIFMSLYITNGYTAERLSNDMNGEQYILPLSETVYYFLIIVFVVLMLALLICRIVIRFERLKRELKYVNLEIGRTSGSERKYWKKKKRRLWLSLIPFYKA